MPIPPFHDVQVGDRLPALDMAAIHRSTRAFSLRCTGIPQLGHTPTVTGRITEKFEAEGEQRVRVELQCNSPYGGDWIVGEAVLALR